MGLSSPVTVPQQQRERKGKATPTEWVRLVPKVEGVDTRKDRRLDQATLVLSKAHVRMGFGKEM